MTDYPDIDPAEYRALTAARARNALTIAPELVEHVRSRRIPFGAAPIGQTRSGSRTPPAPLSVGAVDDADQVFADLTEYVRRWAAALHVTTLTIRLRNRWVADDVVLGFNPTTSTEEAAESIRNLTTWLLAVHDRIADHPDGLSYFEDVATLIERIYSRFPLESRPERPPLPRPCLVCGRYTMTVEWKPDAAVRDLTIYCRPPVGCGHVLVSTDAAGKVQQREYAKVVRDIAAGSTVPHLEGAPA